MQERAELQKQAGLRDRKSSRITASRMRELKIRPILLGLPPLLLSSCLVSSLKGWGCTWVPSYGDCLGLDTCGHPLGPSQPLKLQRKSSGEGVEYATNQRFAKQAQYHGIQAGNYSPLFIWPLEPSSMRPEWHAGWTLDTHGCLEGHQNYPSAPAKLHQEALEE